MYSVITTERPELPTDEDLLNSRKRLFNTISTEQISSIERSKSIWGIGIGVLLKCDSFYHAIHCTFISDTLVVLVFIIKY